MLCISLFCILSYFTMSIGTNVQSILEPPSLTTIQEALEARGGTYTPACGIQIQELVHEMLKGTFVPSCEMPTKEVSSEHMKAFLASKPGKALTTEVVKKLHKHLPSLRYGHLVKCLLEACQATHFTISRQKEFIAQEDLFLDSSPILRTAHALALETVIRLLFTMASHHSEPCERMHALYLLNLIHLYGSRGVALQRYRDRANRFYFTYEGILRGYDPSKDAACNPKQVKAIDRFLRLVSRTKSQYLHFLSMGMSYGIGLLQPYYEKATQDTWSAHPPGFIWRYAASLFKEITTLDVIAMRTVTPEKIFAHQANKDFVELMLHCALKTSESLKKASTLITTYKNRSESDPLMSTMERYYYESANFS